VKKRIGFFAVAVLLMLLAAMSWIAIESSSNGRPSTHSVGSASSSAPTSRTEPVATPATSGSRARRAHTTPPAELPGGPVREYLPDLLKRASGPNPSADAALAAFYALNACRYILQSPDHADTGLTRPNLQDCAGITEKDWADAARLLKLAADLGNERAQLAYARKEPLSDKKLEDFVQKPEELVEFRNNANRYLLAASEAGNLDAMWFLSESLRTGDLMEANLAAAYQYKYAISRAGGYPHTINAELARLESQLTPEQVAAARESADKFLARCCR
jgi:hypothetical protein